MVLKLGSRQLGECSGGVRNGAYKIVSHDEQNMRSCLGFRPRGYAHGEQQDEGEEAQHGRDSLRGAPRPYTLPLNSLSAFRSMQRAGMSAALLHTYRILG